MPIAFCIGRQQDQARTRFNLKLAANQKVQANRRGGVVSTHDTSQRAFIGESKGSIAEQSRLLNQLLRI